MRATTLRRGKLASDWPVVAMAAAPTASTAWPRRPQAIVRHLDAAVVVELMCALSRRACEQQRRFATLLSSRAW